MVMDLALPLEHFEGHRPSIAREKYIRLLRGLSPNNLTPRGRLSGLLCVARGPFLVVAAMVMEVVVGRWTLVAPCFHQHIPTVGIVQSYLRMAFILV
jgi:hypothetical protein